MNEMVEVLRDDIIYFYLREHYIDLLEQSLDFEKPPPFNRRWLEMADYAYTVEDGLMIKSRSGEVSPLESIRDFLRHPPKFTIKRPKERR